MAAKRQRILFLLIFYLNIISKQPVSLYFELDNGKQQHLCKYWTEIQQKRESDDEYNNGNTAGT